MPDISVIVPVYNVEWYLEECLDSLVSQTCRNIEFICLDDGSTDRSPQILERYAGRDKRIRVIHKENEGYGKTMNKGLELAASPWIGIVESDDFIRADMFEKLYAAAAGSQADIIKCNFYKYKTREGKDTEYSREYPEYLFEKEICPLRHPEIYDAHSSIWAGIYRKDFLDKNGIRFRETPGASYQDISFHFRVLSDAGKIKLIKDALLYYRSDNPASSVYNPDKIHCVAGEMQAIEEYIKSQPQKKQDCLWPVFTRKKFYDYRWNYMRMNPQSQYAFLKQMRKEFKMDYEQGRFENLRWIHDYNRDELLEIINDPFSFYVRTENRKYADERLQLVKTVKKSIYLKGLLQEIREAERTVIYGAGVRGKKVARRLLDHGVPVQSLVFAVTHTGPEREIEGIRVKEIENLVCGEAFIIVAVKEDTQPEMLGNLQRLGFENMILADEEFMDAIGMQ